MSDERTDRPIDARHVQELEARVAELERELLDARDRGAATRRRLERELDRTSQLARERERALAQSRAELQRLRGRRVVRLGLVTVQTLKGPISAARAARDATKRMARRTAQRLGLRRLLHGNRGGMSTDEFVARLTASLPPAPEAKGRVSVIIDARTNAATLARCLESLQDTEWDDLEILVAGPHADNMVRTATRGDQRSPGGRRRIRPVTGGTAADSRREALSICDGEFVLFMHDDVWAIESTWLRRMVAAIGEEDAGAVGARLILPRGGGDRASGVRDLTHAGIGLNFVPVDGLPEPRPIGLGSDPLAAGASARVERPAAGEACLLLTRATIDEVGLPVASDEAEPAELCLRLRQSGRRIVVEGGAVLWHRQPFREAAAEPPRLQGELSILADRWGPLLYRTVLQDRLAGLRRWSLLPLRVGITLTRDDEKAGFGDWYTAHELGDAIERLGWAVAYLERERDHWYEGLDAFDVIVSLREGFDLFRVPRSVITIAWIRNWTEAWTAKPWFDNYDLVLVSSARSKELVEQQSAKPAHLFPIATNPLRFGPRPARADLVTDAVFVGSHWGVERGVDRALPELAAAGHHVAIFGRGWEDQGTVSGLAQGLRGYDELADIYASAALAIDDAATGTKPYGSVNSRVFDALATGTLVVSDNAAGVHELFDADFPTWEDPESLVEVAGALLADPERRRHLAERYQRMVLDHHTYDHRAAELRAILGAWAAAPKVAAHIGPQSWELGRTWGDVPFGRDVQRQLERRGYPTAVLVHDEQTTAAAVRADVAVHIFGVRAPRTIRSQTNALWVISHPDRVTEALCETYDLVFLASDMLLEHLERRVDVPLVPLHQATEPSRFYPDPSGPRHQLLFVGNSRGVQRPIIEDLRDTPWDLAVYGGGWTAELLDPKHLQGEWVSNDELRTYYSSAEIVLNDHWGDMRDLGIISNRIYDALACGAFVVSDSVPGIEAEFDGAVATYETREELLAIIARFLNDPSARAAAAARGRAAVLARHTFEIRIARMLAELEPLLAARRVVLDPAVEAKP